ncbi:MAG: hypothetical protein LBB66_07820 [Desulfovibrio sp.]|jgi:hypothetical protein|nr:hypothetical protein [Desulfovibrio sp.]
MDHKIIMNWMYPRSCSTVFMQALSQNAQIQTVFEPFLPIYWNVHANEINLKHEGYDGWPTEYEAIKEKLYGIAKSGPVFVKECAFHALDRFLADEDFLRRCTHTFQIRDLRRCLLSSWKVRGTQKRRLEELSCEASFRIYEKLRDMRLHVLDGGITPLVVDGDDFQDDPAGILKIWCEHMNLEYNDSMLRWEAKWRKEYDHWEACYRDVGHSNGVQRHMEAFLYDEGVIAAAFNDLPAIKLCYDHHQPFHEILSKYRIRPTEASERP